MFTKFKYFFKTNENFTPLSQHGDNSTKRIYYKIYSYKSIQKFNIALDKLGIKNLFYKHYNEDELNDILEYDELVDGVVYLLIDFFDNGDPLFNDIVDFEIITNDESVNPQYDNFYGRDYGGEIYIDDYELGANKYNL